MAVSSQHVTVVFDKPATIISIEAICNHLNDALQTASVVEVDCRAVTEVDVCFLQALISARVVAKRRGVELRLRQPLARTLSDALERSGLVAKSGPPRPDQEFWAGGV
ncbi:STAS domain-containing protein [Azospirillum agricola]|uniref:STAS domain-containing protein n=1 Tax=Azospirillum agricola TaxID=1720247 RepID=UPI000A0F092A|nr:STAS domain-containing protein [Azospirillum agricola]SMH28905.1 STAS domain-containing protein [Azospirillum lipoferum]